MTDREDARVLMIELMNHVSEIWKSTPGVGSLGPLFFEKEDPEKNKHSTSSIEVKFNELITNVDTLSPRVISAALRSTFAARHLIPNWSKFRDVAVDSLLIRDFTPEYVNHILRGLLNK